MIKKYDKGIGFNFKNRLGVCFRITPRFKLKIWTEYIDGIKSCFVNLGKIGIGFAYKRP
jgi:hypothetical protein